MLSVEEIEQMRRSQAMGGLPRTVVDELLAAAAQMARERGEIAEVLNTLPASFTAVREALNRLSTIVG
jgi:hypothetical protein